VLRATGPEFIVLGAHHDSAPGAPGAYDDGGGVGVLIEAARTLAHKGDRARTIVFVSWDAEEAWAQRKTTAAGSRAFIRELAGERANLIAAVAIEMCGWAKGTPTLHPVAYPDPNRPTRPLIAPGWLVRAAMLGARSRGATLHVGDPYLWWLYQPAVRTLRVRFYGDDLSFVQEELPAIFLSDSSFSAFYPWYHEPGDTADKLDPAALARMGGAVLAITDALGQVPRGPAADPVWYAVPGYVAGASVVFALGIASLLPGLWLASRRGGAALGVRLAHGVLFAILLWRHPVPTVWILALPNVLPLFVRGFWLRLTALAPAGALAALGIAAWHRGATVGLWFAPWELAALGLALLCAWFLPSRKRSSSRPRSKPRRGLPKR
jgi:Peptidase family M28